MKDIEVRGVSKKFKLPVERADTLFERIVSLLSGGLRYREFWALKDVSFEVESGEIFGIIGPNGGGKTTLLSIVSGIMPADGGEVRVRGKVVPILGLGVGFNPELSVRDNVIIYGTIMGLLRNHLVTSLFLISLSLSLLQIRFADLLSLPTAFFSAYTICLALERLEFPVFEKKR